VVFRLTCLAAMLVVIIVLSFLRGIAVDAANLRAAEAFRATAGMTLMTPAQARSPIVIAQRHLQGVRWIICEAVGLCGGLSH
jgi:hypothetical protein